MRIGVFLLLCVCGFAMLPASAEIYRWVDAEGRVMYGDEPPAKSKAKPITLPTLTVADGFVPQKPAQTEPAKQDDAAYSDFRIESPARGETIRANDGNLTVSIALKPKLKEGDSVALYVDSKQTAAGSSLSFPLSELERGEHTVFAVLSDAKGNIIQNTETVTFNLQKGSQETGDSKELSNTDTQKNLQDNMYGSSTKAMPSTFTFPSLPKP